MALWKPWPWLSALFFRHSSPLFTSMNSVNSIPPMGIFSMEEIYVAILETLPVHESRLTALEQARRDDRDAQKVQDAQQQQWLILAVSVSASLLAALIGVVLPLWAAKQRSA